MTITIRVNDTEQSVAARDDTPLLWVLRDWMGLKGTQFGCGIGQCGACTVPIDGEAKRSCETNTDDERIRTYPRIHAAIRSVVNGGAS